jgi:hypothetical protein
VFERKASLLLSIVLVGSLADGIVIPAVSGSNGTVLVQLSGEQLDVKVAGSARLDQGVNQMPGLAGVEEAEEGASNHAGSPIEPI